MINIFELNIYLFNLGCPSGCEKCKHDGNTRTCISGGCISGSYAQKSDLTCVRKLIFLKHGKLVREYSRKKKKF